MKTAIAIVVSLITTMLVSVASAQTPAQMQIRMQAVAAEQQAHQSGLLTNGNQANSAWLYCDALLEAGITTTFITDRERYLSASTWAISAQGHRQNGDTSKVGGDVLYSNGNTALLIGTSNWSQGKFATACTKFVQAKAAFLLAIENYVAAQVEYAQAVQEYGFAIALLLDTGA